MALFRRGVRWIVVAALLLVVLAAALVLALAFALDRGTLARAAEARLSAMLGQPVAIGAIRFSLLPRVALTGSEIRVGAVADEAPAVELRGVHIVPRLRSLVRRPVVVEEVRLDGLIVSVLRDREGRWHVPRALPGPADERDAGVIIERVRVDAGRVVVFEEIAGGGVREASSIDDLHTQVELAADGLRLAPITGRIGGAAIAGEARTDAQAAHLEFTADAIADEDLTPLLRLGGGERPDFLQLPQPASASVNLRIDRTARLSGTGSLHAPAIVLDRLRLERFEAPFSIDRARVILEPTAFGVYGGAHSGVIALEFGAAPPHWSIDSRLTGVDVGNLLNALATSDARLEGNAAVSAALRGRFGDPLDRTLQGRAHVAVTDGVLREFPLLAFINSALRLAEGDSRDTRFERLAATLAFTGGDATTEDLVMQAGHVRVEAAGRIGADRSLALSGQAVVSAERSAEAIRSIRELSALRNDRGELELPLSVSGRLDDPSFDLDLKSALGKSLLDELRRRLPGVIRRPEGASR